MTPSANASRGLHEILPREQVGPATGERYEFQYHQAAADALLVLDEGKVVCVYFEWHDDYVIEAAGTVDYHFHQVKTRGLQRGPWKLTEFFGHRRPAKAAKPPANAGKSKSESSKSNPDDGEGSICTRMLDHLFKFEERCAAFVFVTDAGIHPDFQGFLDGVLAAGDVGALAEEHQKTLAAIAKGLAKVDARVTMARLFQFLKHFSVRPPVGKLDDLRGCKTLIAGRIRELSEVDLRISEAEKIGAELVSIVRSKSHTVLGQTPDEVTVLRQKKGLVLDEVLRVLSLSPAGYRALNEVGRPAVVALSRLHRLCRESKIDEALIPDLCNLKSSWDAWWVEQRHLLNRLDVLTLKKEAGEALRLHAEGTLDLKELRNVALELAKKYQPVLTSSRPLTDEVVFGLMLSVAVEAEQ